MLETPLTSILTEKQKPTFQEKLVQTRNQLYTLGMSLFTLATSPAIVQATSKAVVANHAVKNTITKVDIRHDDQATHLIIEAEQPFVPEVRQWEDPCITAVTVPAEWVPGYTQREVIEKGGLKVVRYGRFQDGETPQFRMAAEGYVTLDYSSRSNAEKTHWEITLWHKEANAETIRTSPLKNRTKLRVAAPIAIKTNLKTEKSVKVVATTSLTGLPNVNHLGMTSNFSSNFLGTMLPLMHSSTIATVNAHPATTVNAHSATAKATTNNKTSSKKVTLSPATNTLPAAMRMATNTVRQPERVLFENLPVTSAIQPKHVVMPAKRITPVKAVTPSAITAPVTRRQVLPGTTALPQNIRPNALAPTIEPTTTAMATVTAPRIRRAERLTLEQAMKRRVSVNMVDARIPEVLKAIQVQYGINIIAAPDAVGNITIAVDNLPLREVLDLIVRLSGNHYATVGQTIVVGKNLLDIIGPSNNGPSITMVIPFYYSDGEDLKKAVVAAYPTLEKTLAMVKPSAESKEVSNKAVSTSGTAGTGSNNATETVKITPRGGVLSVVGTENEVEQVQKFVESMENKMIASAAQQQAIESNLKKTLAKDLYNIHYADAEDLIRLIKSNFPEVDAQAGPAVGLEAMSLGGGASFTSGGGGGSNGGGGGNVAKTRSLVLTAPPEAMDRVKTFLGRVDVRTAQLVYEARIVEVNNNDLKNLGLDWDVSMSTRIGETNGNRPPIATGGSGTATAGSRPLPMGAIGRSPYSLGVQLTALAENGKARLLASPNLSALEGVEASTFIGDQFKYIIGLQQTPQGVNIQTDEARIGITLKVKGQSSNDGSITMFVHPEVSTISGYVNVGQIALPQISTRFVDTTVRMKDGETIAIAGLIREQEIENTVKVPGLGELPVVGKLFSRTRKEKSNSQIVVFITAKVQKD
jgi:type II secretory pathway component GspD/PulD (secretin)